MYIIYRRLLNIVNNPLVEAHSTIDANQSVNALDRIINTRRCYRRLGIAYKPDGGKLEMILLKDCLKCRGDLVLCHDHYGDYFSCIQCGLIRETIPIGLGLESPANMSVQNIDAEEGQVVAS